MDVAPIRCKRDDRIVVFVHQGEPAGCLCPVAAIHPEPDVIAAIAKINYWDSAIARTASGDIVGATGALGEHRAGKNADVSFGHPWFIPFPAAVPVLIDG